MNRWKRIELFVGLIFLTLGIGLVIHSTILTNRINSEHILLTKQVKCNNELIDVLRTRSEARNVVDYTTRDSQFALVAYLNDVIENGANIMPNDPHVIEVRDKYEKATAARNNPDLHKPYPVCVGVDDHGFH